MRHHWSCPARLTGVCVRQVGTETDHIRRHTAPPLRGGRPSWTHTGADTRLWSRRDDCRLRRSNSQIKSGEEEEDSRRHFTALTERPRSPSSDWERNSLCWRGEARSWSGSRTLNTTSSSSHPPPPRTGIKKIEKVRVHSSRTHT